MKNLLIALILALTLTSCSHEIRTVYAKPECSPPPKPNLPYIDAQKLYDKIGHEMYESLLKSNRLRDSYANEMRYIIEVLCQ